MIQQLINNLTILNTAIAYTVKYNTKDVIDIINKCKTNYKSKFNKTLTNIYIANYLDINPKTLNRYLDQEQEIPIAIYRSPLLLEIYINTLD